jgi:acetate kinase
MPELAQRFPLPRRLWDREIRRYGFHGLSYEYVVATLGADARGRLVVAHIGNGASLAAIRDGVPVDTTMGLTPTGGIMMGTRPGDLDPGLLLYLMRERGLDVAACERLLNEECGLLGVSGTTADMRTLLARRAEDPRAADAVAMFCASVRRAIGAFAAALDGIDTLVFTGGIGEHAAPVRAEICAGLGHLGIAIDAAANAAHGPVMSASHARCAVRVVATDEDLMVARHTRDVVVGAPR